MLGFAHAQRKTGVNTGRFPSSTFMVESVADGLSQGLFEFYPPFTSCSARFALM